MVSGGVASNLAVREGLVRLVKHFNMEAVFPPPRLCTDNGVMIAWAGLEALKINETGVAPKDVLGVEVLPTKDFSLYQCIRLRLLILNYTLTIKSSLASVSCSKVGNKRCTK